VFVELFSPCLVNVLIGGTYFMTSVTNMGKGSARIFPPWRKDMQESSNRTCYPNIVETLMERCIFLGTDNLQKEVLNVSKMKL